MDFSILNKPLKVKQITIFDRIKKVYQNEYQWKVLKSVGFFAVAVLLVRDLTSIDLLPPLPKEHPSLAQLSSMISSSFVDALVSRGIDRFYGVPDSLLKSFNHYVYNHAVSSAHAIAVNEGSAVAMAIGHYLSTGRYALVYMQNSGLGNAVNPLVSLCSSEVCGIPMLLMIGWRASPGMKDEPQHALQGKITLEMLDLMKIPYEIMDVNSDTDRLIAKSLDHMNTKRSPFAFVVKPKAFDSYASSDEIDENKLSREEALRFVIEQMPPNARTVSTTGYLSRELFEIKGQQKLDNTFLSVGGMGHASGIALGIALSRKGNRPVVCLDGDGACLMHMGIIGQIGHLSPSNFHHIIFNNGVHDSVGGQKTVASFIANIFTDTAKAAGYRLSIASADSERTIREGCEQVFNCTDGPTMLEIRIRRGVRSDLKRPPQGNPAKNTIMFVKAN